MLSSDGDDYREDETDNRTKKMKNRFDHYLAQQVAEGDKELRAHKIRGKTHQNRFPMQNIVIWMEAVVTTQRSSTSGVQHEMMEVTTSWTMTPMSSTTGPTLRVSDA